MMFNKDMKEETLEQYIKERKLDNPFNSNHVFSKEDMLRKTITWKDKMRVFFKRRFVQINDGYVFTYKIGNDGTYYLLGYESLR